MKPVGMSRGRGIRLIDDIKNISYADKVTAWKLGPIAKPALARQGVPEGLPEGLVEGGHRIALFFFPLLFLPSAPLAPSSTTTTY